MLPRLWLVATLFQFVPAGGIYAQEVLDEEVGAFVFAEVFAHGVVGAGDEDELEVLVGLDEGVDDLVGGGGIDVVVLFADEEHELALEVLGVLDVGGGDVGAIDGITHPLLVPPDFVHTVIMTPAGCIGCLVEVTVPQYCCHSVLSAG